MFNIDKNKLKPFLDNYLKKIGYTLVTVSHDMCPKDTGTLAKSIEIKSIDNNTVKVGTDIYYAKFVEYGTRKMRAQPYLRPSLDTLMSHMR